MIEELPPLPPTLKILRCNLNQLTSLPSLPETIELIGANANRLNDIPVLIRLTKLKELHLINNRIRFLPPLPDNLEVLVFPGNQIDNIEYLPPKLTKLNCCDNGLTCLPPIPNTVRELIFNNNEIQTLPKLPDSLQLSSYMCERNPWTPKFKAMMEQKNPREAVNRYYELKDRLKNLLAYKNAFYRNSHLPEDVLNYIGSFLSAKNITLEHQIDCLEIQII